MAKMLAVFLLAGSVVSFCHGQGYGGVPQGVKGVRTTTTFAPDVIPSDKQAEIFYQQHPNPEDIQTPSAPPNREYNPGLPQGSNPQYNKPNPGVPQGSNPQYNKPNPGVPQGSNPQYNKPNPGVPQGSNPQYNKPNPGVPQGSNPQYNKPNPGVPQGSNPQYNKPNPGVPQGSNPQYNKPNPGVPQGSNPQYNKPNPGVPQGSNSQPVGQYPGPLPDNSIYAGSFTDSQSPGGNFWWMNQDNPFKGAGVPSQPPKGSGPPQGGPPPSPTNNPNNPFLSGGNKPAGPYPAQSGNKPAGPYPAQSGNNPNNPFLSGGNKPAGPYPAQSGNNPNNLGCAGNSGCGSQAPQGESYPGNAGIPCTGSGYLCVSKSNCNNGVVVDNGLLAKTGVQRCDAVSQVCCRLPSPGNVPAKPIGGNPPYQGPNPVYQGQGSAPGTNGVPIGGSIYDRPVTPNPVITPYTGPLNVTPYPGCAAALKCVEIIYCTVEGVMVDTPQALTREQEENRVPLSECSNPETGILGKCCRDPNYKDPWPGGMMMHVHTDGDGTGQLVDAQGFPTGQYVASHGSSQQPRPNIPQPNNPGQQYSPQFQQGSQNIPQPQPFPQAPQNVPQPQPFPQAPQNVPQPQPFPQAPQNVPQPQPFPQAPQNVPQPQPFPQAPQNIPKPQPFPQAPQNVPQPQPFPQAPQNVPQPQPFPQAPQNVPQPQPFPQAPQNIPKPQPFPQAPQNVPQPQPFPQAPRPVPVVPEYQPQKPDLPPWQPTQVNFASQTPEKVPGYPTAPQQQYEPASNFPAASVSDQRCGIKGNVDRSGISDLDVAQGEFPWHAMILSAADGKPLCSAVVVSDQAILTAAHCVNNLESREISVSLGTVSLGAQSGHPVVAIARHPKFDAISQFNDLAVVFLKQAPSGQRPICLPQNSGVVGGKCIATGFSRKAIQSNSGTLHQVPVYSVPRDVCEQKLKSSNLGKYFVLNPSFTCALPTNSQISVCKVGAGSPIACERSGEYQLGGTYSWDVGCSQEETPAALAVPDVDWIRSVISRPIADVLREEQNEVEKRKASQEVLDSESKPGFSQGYGK